MASFRKGSSRRRRAGDFPQEGANREGLLPKGPDATKMLVDECLLEEARPVEEAPRSEEELKDLHLLEAARREDFLLRHARRHLQALTDGAAAVSAAPCAGCARRAFGRHLARYRRQGQAKLQPGRGGRETRRAQAVGQRDRPVGPVQDHPGRAEHPTRLRPAIGLTNCGADRGGTYGSESRARETGPASWGNPTS